MTTDPNEDDTPEVLLRPAKKSLAENAADDRHRAEGRGTYNHAITWLNGVKHLYPEKDIINVSKHLDYLLNPERYVRFSGHSLQAKDIAPQINNFMDDRFPGLYPKFDPNTVSNVIPDHLGPQFGE